MKKLQLLVLSALVFANANGQRLPHKQEASIRIPANVKIDGTATEWNNRFQAFNSATDLSYTFANNNEELYLVIQTRDRNTFSKITYTGLTLSVKNPKSGKNVSFTFPHKIGKANVASTFSLGMVTAAGKVSEREIAGYNKFLSDKHKFIKVEGVEGVDSLLSVYNENGVQAAESFGNNKAYTLEMSINLKLLGVLVNEGSKILFQLKVNPTGDSLTVDLNEVHMPNGGGVPPERRDEIFAASTMSNAKMYGGTEFKGEYTLAK